MTEHRGSEDCLPAGTELLQGQFIIDQFLNAGGFGITYLARDRLERRVVIKECFPTTMCCRTRHLVKARSSIHQPEFDAVVRLFGQEARRLAKLSHPNIVGVHDVFEDFGTAYMVLDFVDGHDLADVIAHQPERLTPDFVQSLVVKLLEAVDHVHAQGILHRDISPDNILIDEHNEPVLIDFGAARDTARTASRVLSALCVVKDGYSPQEFYLQGTEQSPASDLYALAATLYHVLIGEAPVSSQVRLAALAERKPDPHLKLAGRVTGYSAGFVDAIDATLQIFARDRLQSAEEWGTMLGFDRVEPRMDDPHIMSAITQLVEETNLEVRVAQDQAEKDAEAEALRQVMLQQEAEARRERLREEAIREAAEAEQRAAERKVVLQERADRRAKGLGRLAVNRRPWAKDSADPNDADAPRGLGARIIGRWRRPARPQAAMEGIDP